MPIKAKITFDTKQMERAMDKLADRLPATLEVAVQSGIGLVVSHTVKTKLTGQVLNRVTSNLIRDVVASQRVERRGRVITGSYGTTLGYGRDFEEGFSGSVQIPAHQRGAHTRTAHVRQALSGSQQVREAQVSAHQVRAHVAQVDIRARHYLRDSLREKLPQIGKRVDRAVTLLLRDGRIPKLAALRGT